MRLADGDGHPDTLEIRSEDGLLAMVRGQAPLWVSGGWAAKTGLPADMVLGQETASARAHRLDPAQLSAYTQAVFAQTDADLDREVDLTSAGMGKTPLAQFLAGALLGNTYAHTGEISALKGMQSAKGYPF